MSKIWIIADTHFFHGNIIKYCDRPFKDYKEMNEELIKRWNSKVSPTDLVIHLGDFGWGHRERIKETRKKLNGRIILIKGNHDKEYINKCGFLIVEGSMTIGNLILTHHPLLPHEIPNGFKNVHGHIHHLDSFHGINVSVEKTDYYPILLESLIAK